jgi:hypothetical protein
VPPDAGLFDDVVLLATLVSVSCHFDAGQRCEVKWIIDGAHGHEGQLRVQTVSKEQAETLKHGDVYGIHIRRL